MMCISIRGNRELSVELDFSVGMTSGCQTNCQTNCQTSLQDFLVSLFITVILIEGAPCSLSHLQCVLLQRVLIRHKFKLSLFCFATDMFYELEQPIENLDFHFLVFSCARCSSSQRTGEMLF